MTFPAALKNRVFGRIVSGPILSLFTNVLIIKITLESGSEGEFRDISGRCEKGRFCSGGDTLFYYKMTIHTPIYVTNRSSGLSGSYLLDYHASQSRTVTGRTF